MPIYDYKCGQCNAITTAIRSFDEVYNAPECCQCGAETHKIISQGIRSTVSGQARKGNYNSGDRS